MIQTEKKLVHCLSSAVGRHLLLGAVKFTVDAFSSMKSRMQQVSNILGVFLKFSWIVFSGYYQPRYCLSSLGMP